jgi:hypothetical protein
MKQTCSGGAQEEEEQAQFNLDFIKVEILAIRDAVIPTWMMAMILH